MIWLTWRQFRGQAAAALGVLVATVLLLTLTGPHLTDLYRSSGLPQCSGADACGAAKGVFFSGLKDNTLYPVLYFALVVLLFLAPAVIGLFWGAPLVAREVEAGTFRLAWVQSVPRLRWLSVKLGLLGLAAAVTAGVLSLGASWWSAPIDRAAAAPGTASGQGEPLPNHFAPLIFGARGLVPIACAIFAFALGVAAGVLLRRLLPAMAATLLLVVAVQVLLPMTIRAHYLTPKQTTVAMQVSRKVPGTSIMISGGRLSVSQPVEVPGAWVSSVRTVGPDGRPWSGAAPQACTSPTATDQQCFAAINALGLRQTAEYQPADRFWDFQGIESGLYLLGAAGLAGLCGWRLRSLRLG